MYNGFTHSSSSYNSDIHGAIMFNLDLRQQELELMIQKLV